MENGKFNIFRSESGVEKLISTGGRGSCVGELALLHNSPRTTTVKVNADLFSGGKII